MRRLAGTMVAALAVLGTSLSVAPAAQATGHSAPGTTSLAEVLAADGDTFDTNKRDYDIVFQAALAVLEAKPESAVAVLTDGSVPLTAFIPRDQAFRKLAYALTGDWIRSEEKVFTTLAGALGIDTIEAVLLYHVVPGATITYRMAKKSDGAVLSTALEGATITVDVTERRCWWKRVSLVDNDPNAWNPRVVQRDINKGNVQIAHGIDRVLRPVDL